MFRGNAGSTVGANYVAALEHRARSAATTVFAADTVTAVVAVNQIDQTAGNGDWAQAPLTGPGLGELNAEL